MLKKSLILVFSLISIITGCSRSPEGGAFQVLSGDVLYGNDAKTDDNRSETNIESIMERNNVSLETSEMWLNLSKSTAGMVKSYKLKKEDDFYVLNESLDKLRKIYDLCSGERFADQVTLPVCSGTLVGKDLIVTAGHCINQDDFKEKLWLFDFNNEKSFLVNPRFPKDDVYESKEVVFYYRDNNGADMALVRLDREVVGREPLAFRTNGKINDGQNLVIIGHPHGLTTKIAGGAFVTDNSNPEFFKANTDSCAGNSGSAVFDAESGIIEGILVRGEKDWVGSICKKANHLNLNEGKEAVTRITYHNISQYLNELPIETEGEVINQVIFNPDLLNLNLKRESRGLLNLGKKEISIELVGDSQLLNLIESVSYSTNRSDFEETRVNNNNFKFVFRSRWKSFKINVVFYLKDNRTYSKSFSYKF